MSVTREELLKVAKLARLELREEEIPKLLSSMDSIVGYMESLRELDLDNVEPMLRVDESKGSLRKDETAGCLEHEKAIENAPDGRNGFFAIPKVIG